MINVIIDTAISEDEFAEQHPDGIIESPSEV